jgi:hypothetical protein
MRRGKGKQWTGSFPGRIISGMNSTLLKRWSAILLAMLAAAPAARA